MKIKSLETFLANAGQRNYLFVRVKTDTGLIGIGEATLEWQEKAVEVLVNEWVASRIIGKDPFDIEAVVGGMHLFHSPLAPLRFARDMRRLAADLAAYEGTRYYTGHCSVEDGCVRLEKRLGNRLGRIASGGVLEL